MHAYNPLLHRFDSTPLESPTQTTPSGRKWSARVLHRLIQRTSTTQLLDGAESINIALGACLQTERLGELKTHARVA